MKNNDQFPKLTILSDTPQPPTPRLSNSEKYGSLYWIGISGLAVSVALVSYFTWNLVGMRHVWRAVYVLHDESQAPETRLQAAEALIADPRVEPSQVQPMIFRKSLPDKARYLLAESLDKSLTTLDARQMLSLIANDNAASPPQWLRGHLARLAAVSLPIRDYPTETFRSLMDDDNVIVADWAAYALARLQDEALKATGLDRLESRTKEGSPLAKSLLDAARSDGPSMTDALTAATRAMRSETEITRSFFDPAVIGKDKPGGDNTGAVDSTPKT